MIGRAPGSEHVDTRFPTGYNRPMEAEKYSYRCMSTDEVADVCHFVNSVFDRSVAPLYTKRGRCKFREYADPEATSLRIRSDHFVLLAVEDGRVAGIIEMRLPRRS